MSRWFRHYAGMMRDDKLVRVAIRAKQPVERVVWVWGAILESAAEIDDNGRFDVDAAEVAYFLRADQSDIDAVFDGLASLGRIAADTVVNWGDRQFSSDSSKERVAAYRERQRAKGSRDNSQRGVTVTTCNGDVTAQETETETDISEPKGSSPRPFDCPVGVSRQVWSDFMDNRKRKKLGKTATAWKSFNDDLARVSAQTGIPPPILIERCTAKGWGAIYDPRDNRHERTDNNPLQSAVQRIIGQC